MSTTYTPPLNLHVPTLPSFTLPTNAAAQSVVSPFAMAPPAPLPQTLFGSANTVGFPIG